MQNSTSNFSHETGKETLTNWGEAATATFSTNSISQKGQSATAQHTNYMADVSESDEEDSEVESFHLDHGELDDEAMFETPKYLLSGEGSDSPDLHSVDPETQARLEALLEAAGIGKLSTADGKHFADPEVLRKLTSSVSCALDEAAAALSRMRAESGHLGQEASLTEACSDGDAGAVKKLLEEGRNVNETTEEGDSLLSLACQAGYYELAQVLLAMRANVEDRGIKGDCTPLMEAASAGHLDIVNLLITHKADVNAQSSSGNTPLMYACAGGHVDVVRCLLEAHANVEDHNENGHTPLMEAASAGHVEVAKLLLEHGAGVNTHSNEFKESALTLACYKGHIEMVRFLLEAGADQEHKTDEMHTALMEASMDGHVEVARLLLDSGAQVNMPADSFESPLTLAACGGHVELAMLLLERGANIEEVNDEGYTPLMEAAREGHEEMVALLLGQGADINAQTEETAETALTLACCGGFREVAEFLIKAGANIELGASTPLMEAAQEGRLELVTYLLADNANVHAVTQTGDTALTYACENGHTDVADLLLQAGANLEHESEGGRTPLMKAARAGHYCTVQFLVSRGADVNRQTSNNDHTPLSLACAGGHYQVVEFLLSHNADPSHRLKDNSTMLIEAAKGGHTQVVQLLLDYPQSIVATSTTPDLPQISTPTFENPEVHRVPPHGIPHSVPPESDPNSGVAHAYYHSLQPGIPAAHLGKQESKHVLRSSNTNVRQIETLTTAEQQQVKNAPHLTPSYSHEYYDFEGALVGNVGGSEVTSLDLEKDVKPCERLEACINSMMKKAEQLHHNREEQILQKQQILEELQRVERELQEKAYAQLHIEHHTVQGLVQACALASTSSAHSFGGSLLDLGQGITPDGQLGLGFKSPVGLPSLSPCILEGAQSLPSATGTALPSAGQMHDMSKVKPSATAPGKKDSKVLKQKDPKLQQQPQHQLIEESEKLNVKGRSLSPDSFVAEAFQGLQLTSKPLTCSDNGLFERLPFECSESTLGEMVSSSSQEQVQSQDSAVVSVGMGMHPLQAPTPTVANVQLPDDKVPKNKSLKSITQIKNHLNSVTVNTIMGNLPLSTAVTIPQLPSSPQLVLSQQPYSSTTTVATQYIDPNLPTSSLTVPFLTSTTVPVAPQVPLQNCPLIDVNSQTDSNHDTALTLACAGGHEELVQLLLARDADIEHRDKKGFTPLILAATAGHAGVVDILLNHGADIEAQSERTKDTPLSLACSGGRYEVVDILLNRGANKEHRNVSDYTPLSLAASGGYVNIIKLLLNHGAEINSRTGSKLGISPLMLAAMNGHTAAVKLLLDMGSDINAQIETNRNTALTLACFQGRHEVVSLLVDRKANVEHRAKTGLTPLMEAASGGYVEVGRVLLDKGADVNAPPVPSSRDTALTIAADKGHCVFVELLLNRGAQVDVKNKKGNSPLWLAANGGHLDVVQRLVDSGADIDSQDNRKVSCLMAAFRRGHNKVVKWMVKKVTQFPSDQEMTRFIATCNDNELLKKCHQCLEIIRIAKDHQAIEANKNASILFEELDMEKTLEESKKAAAARKRERKRKKKKEKQERKLLEAENKKNEAKNQAREIEKCVPVSLPVTTLATTIGKIRNTQITNSNTSQNVMVSEIKQLTNDTRNTGGCSTLTCNNGPNKARTVNQGPQSESSSSSSSSDSNENTSCSTTTESDKRFPGRHLESGKLRNEKESKKERKLDMKSGTGGGIGKDKDRLAAISQASKEKPAVLVTVLTTSTTTTSTVTLSPIFHRVSTTVSSVSSSSITSHSSSSLAAHVSNVSDKKRDLVPNQHFTLGTSIISEDHSSTTANISIGRSAKGKKGDIASSLASIKSISGLPFSMKTQSLLMSSPKRGGKREEGWKEVVRKSKKVSVPTNAISRVIGRGGCNINAIREVSGAVIEVEKQKGASDRSIIIRGPADATRQAHQLITMMIKDPDKDLSEFLPKVVSGKTSVNTKSSAPTQIENANQTYVAVSSGTLTKTSSSTTISKSSNLPPSGVSISNLAFPSSQPPFSAAIRQASFRPGIAMSPAFPSPSPSWQAFPVHSPLTSSKKNAEFGPAVSVVHSSSTTQADAANVLSGSTTTVKSSAARQLFPPEKKSTPQCISSTCTKTTVSYTTAVIGSSKVVKMVPSNSSMSFASKVTDSRAAISIGTNKGPSSQPGKACKAGNGSMISVINAGQHPLPIRSASLPNGPISCPGVGSSPPSTVSSASSSQPGTPALSPPSSLPQQLSGKPRSPTPPFQTVTSQHPVPKEYTPFSGILSSMTESVWKNKECNNNKGMNFASVTAGNTKNVSQLCSIGTPVDDGPCLPPVDVAKAPGYRGNAHVSPGCSSGIGMSNLISSDPICSNSRTCLSNNVCSTPPIGPIAPPVGSSLRKASPPIDSLILPNNPPSVIGPPGPLNSLMKNPFPHLGPHGPHVNIVSHNLQTQASNPNVDLNSNFAPISQHSPPQNHQGAYNPGVMNPNYSLPSTSLGPSNHNVIPSIQSNLNPNAPDFSSRSILNSTGNHLPNQSHPAHLAPVLGQLHLFQDSSVAFHTGLSAMPTFAQTGLSGMVSSTQSSGISPNTMHSNMMGQASGNSINFVQNNAPYPDYSTLPRQAPNMVPNSDSHVVNPARLVSGHLPPPPPNGGINTFLPLMHPQRPGSISHSVSSSSSCKDESSTISPVTSPHPSNPSSPMTLSGLNDHSMRSSLNEDHRKLPRPIGTERAHKKTATPIIPESWGSFSRPSSDPLLEGTHLQPNFMHFGDGLGGSVEDAHQLDQTFPQHHNYVVQRLGAGYQPYMNGIHPRGLIQSMFTPQSGRIWTDSAKLAVGEPSIASEASGPPLPMGGNPGHGSFGPMSQQPSMLWSASNWNQGSN